MYYNAIKNAISMYLQPYDILAFHGYSFLSIGPLEYI